MGRNIAMTMLLSVLLELKSALFPNHGVGIPDETHLLQLLHTLIRKSRHFIFLFQFVLISLSFHPARQARAALGGVWDETVPVLCIEIQELLELFCPLHVLVWTVQWSLVTWTVAF